MSRRPDAQANRIAKRRQQWALAALCAVVGAAVMAIAWLRNKASGPAVLVDETQLAIPGEQLDPGQLWRTSAEEDIRLLEQSEANMREALLDMQQRMAEFAADIEQARIAEQEAAFEREMLLRSSMESPSRQAPPTDSGEAAVPPFVQPPIKLVRVAAGLAAVPPAAAPASSSPPPEPAPAAAAVSAHYLPGGTFMPAVILGGLDAPTGAVARDNPHPVLLRVAAAARLPNLIQRDVSECLVLAAGYGDISSERALLRVERMSCQRADGSFFDEQVRGFIVGDDGRAGVRGRLVTKQGQLLQRSLLAGIGAGFGEVLQTQRTERLRSLTHDSEGNPSPSTLPDFGDYAATGVAAGAGSALSRLADYYISLAERVYPVIEVGAGRRVDIVLQEGVDLRQDAGT